MPVIYSQKIAAQTSILEKRFSFKFKNIPLESVIDSLRKAIDYGFSYNPDVLPQNKIINYNFKYDPLKIIFDSIFLPLNLTYKLVNNNIVIVKLSFANENISSVREIDTVKFIPLSGQVLDKKHNEPVPYVYVYILNKNIGTITNNAGDFIIKIPIENANDSIFFSCIGYNKVVKKVNDLMPGQNLIFLEENYIQIKAVTIKYIDPKTIIKSSFEKINHNYSRIPLMLTAFYRETIKQNHDYVALSEAILRLYKAPYNHYAGDQVMIYKGRKSPFVKQMDTVRFKFQGGIYTCLLLDIAKNPSNFMADEFIDYYDYNLEDIINIQERVTYVIAFDQRENIHYPLYKGKIYIDRESLAIVRVEFMLSPKGIDYAAALLVQKSPSGVKVKPVSSTYIVNYVARNNIWALNYIREEVKFKVHKKFNFYNTLFDLTAEMVITQTDSTNVQRFKTSETVRSKDIFVEKVGKYDDSFWGGFNFIKPDLSLEEALDEIKVHPR